MSEIIKFSKFNESIGGAWEQAISGYDNCLILFCDHAGSKMIKEMKATLKEYKLEAIAKDNKVIILPIEEGNKKSLSKFKKDFLGE